MCGIDAYEPVGFTSCLGRQEEIVEVVTVFEVLQSFLDGLIGQRTDPEALERNMTIKILVELAKNQFTFTSGIGGHNNLLCMLKEVLDDAKLFLHTVILLALGILAADKLENVGDDG